MLNQIKKEPIIGCRLIGSNCRYPVPDMDSLITVYLKVKIMSIRKMTKVAMISNTAWED